MKGKIAHSRCVRGRGRLGIGRPHPPSTENQERLVKLVWLETEAPPHASVAGKVWAVVGMVG